VINIHRKAQNDDTADQVDLVKLKRYIAFCRSKCRPHMSKEASKVLSDHYVSLRSAANSSNSRKAIPITVRQLEAIIRISESLAKMRLAAMTTVADVQEAIRLFTVSTVQAARSGKGSDENMSKEMWEEVDNVETILLRRLPIGSTISVDRLKKDLGHLHFSSVAIAKSLQNLVSKEVLMYVSRGTKLRRKR